MAGGYGGGHSTELYFLDKHQWSEGPSLPRTFSHAPSVNPDPSTLILVGGLDSTAGYFRDDMLSLNTQEMKWEVLPGKIDRDDNGGMAFYGISATVL